VTDFDRAWAVLLRDTGELEGDELDVVDVLRVYRTDEAARAEVRRLRAEDHDENHLYYYEATELERPE
jgi:hypothetical protein